MHFKVRLYSGSWFAQPNSVQRVHLNFALNRRGRGHCGKTTEDQNKYRVMDAVYWAIDHRSLFLCFPLPPFLDNLCLTFRTFCCEHAVFIFLLHSLFLL